MTIKTGEKLRLLILELMRFYITVQVLLGFTFLKFFMLRDDGIKYKSKNKKDSYDLIDDSKDNTIRIKPTPRGQKSTPLMNYSTVKDGVRFLGWTLNYLCVIELH